MDQQHEVDGKQAEREFAAGSSTMQIAALLVAGGGGSRFGSPTPKQFLSLAGKPVMRHAAEGLLRHVTLLQPVGAGQAVAAALAGLPHLPPVPGGQTRQD